MNSSPIASPPLTERQELVRRIGEILLGLAAVVARRFLREPRLVGLTVLLWQKLSRAVRRIERAVSRPARVQAKRRSAQPRGKAPVLAGSVRLPGGRNWLVRELGYEAVAYGLQLQHLLNEPAMQAILANVPAIARVLRPICRMLGVAGLVAAATALPALESGPVSPPPAIWPLTVGGMVEGTAGICLDFSNGC